MPPASWDPDNLPSLTSKPLGVWPPLGPLSHPPLSAICWPHHPQPAVPAHPTAITTRSPLTSARASPFGVPTSRHRQELAPNPAEHGAAFPARPVWPSACSVCTPDTLQELTDAPEPGDSPDWPSRSPQLDSTRSQTGPETISLSANDTEIRRGVPLAMSPAGELWGPPRAIAMKALRLQVPAALPTGGHRDPPGAFLPPERTAQQRRCRDTGSMLTTPTAPTGGPCPLQPV